MEIIVLLPNNKEITVISNPNFQDNSNGLQYLKQYYFSITIRKNLPYSMIVLNSEGSLGNLRMPALFSYSMNAGIQYSGV